MKFFVRFFGFWLLLGCAQIAWSQTALGPKIDRVDIKYVGPASVSEQFIRSHIQLKAGDTYLPTATENDVHALYSTGQFYNIRIGVEQATDGGVNLTYILQVKPRLTEIKIVGNKKMRESKIRKKITAKVGQPLDEEKLFTDEQAIQTLYEKTGYPGTSVKYVINVDEAAGRGTATFQIVEGKKIKITQVEFVGAAAFPQKVLRHEIKTRRKWMFSWLTGSDLFKDDQFEDDKDALADFYRSHGYLDFEIKDVKFAHPTPNTMTIQFFIYEGRQYKVGAVTFSGDKLFNDAQIVSGLKYVHDFQRQKGKLGAHSLPMDSGDVFTPEGMDKDLTAVEDFYGSKGYIQVRQGQGLQAVRVPNVDTGTMDLEFKIDEGQKTYVERIDIRGNVKTKDKVIRRELAISPGDVFDMVRVNISKQRLENLQYFDRVELEPQPTEPPIAGREDLIVNVTEKNTGSFTVGAGYSSVEALVGYATYEQGNFDLFNPPYFTGGGQKLRLEAQLGTELQEYDLSFVEPWFLNRKLALGVDLYRDEWDFDSPHNIYDETRTGARFSLTRALWSDFLTGSISYDIEDVGINLNSGFHGTKGSATPPFIIPRNVPNAILDQTGDHLFNRFAAVLAYDTRNSTELPNWGQRTELDPELSVGDETFYKIQVKTAWFFPGFFPGHVLEADGRVGIANSLSGGDIPFYDRYYLGGIYDLRGFKYRNIGPREPYDPNAPYVANDPIGGDSYWYGSLEYSLPIFEKDNGIGLRLALFYDIGAVGAGSYSFTGNFDDDYGIGLRLNIPHLGPLRLDYGIPINHDKYNGAGGQFNFSAGYTRQF